MTAYYLHTNSKPGPAVCGHIGGTPQLPVATDWPLCRMCESEMVAFLELVLPACPDSGFKAGSRLQIFACREHDEIAGTIYSDYSRFAKASHRRPLPGEYWNITDGHYLLRLLPPSQQVGPSRPEPRLLSQPLVATSTIDETDDGFRLFGQPYWLQDPEPHDCACGAPMQLLLQIPHGLGFAMVPGSEPQPNSYSQSEYCLFLGNHLNLLGCPAQCNPLGLWPVLQN